MASCAGDRIREGSEGAELVAKLRLHSVRFRPDFSLDLVPRLAWVTSTRGQPLIEEILLPLGQLNGRHRRTGIREAGPERPREFKALGFWELECQLLEFGLRHAFSVDQRRDRQEESDASRRSTGTLFSGRPYRRYVTLSLWEQATSVWHWGECCSRRE